MGQAKKRGTFQERQYAAICVNKEIDKKYSDYPKSVRNQIKRARRIKFEKNVPAQSAPAEPSQTP